MESIPDERRLSLAPLSFGLAIALVAAALGLT